jgi:hypothetical protein
MNCQGMTEHVRTHRWKSQATQSGTTLKDVMDRCMSKGSGGGLATKKELAPCGGWTASFQIAHQNARRVVGQRKHKSLLALGLLDLQSAPTPINVVQGQAH